MLTLVIGFSLIRSQFIWLGITLKRGLIPWLYSFACLLRFIRLNLTVTLLGPLFKQNVDYPSFLLNM